MQLGYTILNLVLLWVNTYATFKTLNRRSLSTHSTRSSRIQQRSKREMKSCLSVWVVWVSWTFLERLIDSTVGIFIPFLHEIKCLFLLLLILTRPWGTEPLVLNVLRPAIRPYTGIIDACLHWLELGGDFLFLLLSLPYHTVISWWHSTGEESPVAIESATNGIEEKELIVKPPPPFPEPTTRPDRSVEDVSAATRAAIEAHIKEQEDQAADEVKLKETQARSARDRAAHLRRVAGQPSATSHSNAPSSRTLRVAMQDGPSSSDLPASAINKGTIVSSRNTNRNPLPFTKPDVIPSARNARPDVGESNAPSIYPRAALAMPVPVRAQRPPPKPAVHANLSAAITRPSNPPPQIPSVVIPMSSQTLPRPPRMRPPAHLSQTVGGRSSSTLKSDSSGSTLPVDEFGGVSAHRREAAADDTTDGESPESSSQDAKGQRWEDFMASLERSRLTATLPRGAGGTQMNGSIQRNDATEATRGTEAMVERIAGMKKEVDQKLQQIAAHGNKFPAVPSTQTRPQDAVRARAGVLGSGVQVSTMVGIRTRHATNAQPDVSRPSNAIASSSTLRGGVEIGKKRSRRQSGHFAAMTSSDEDSSSDEAEIERSPKKRRKDLETVDTMDVDSATMVTDSVEGSRPSRLSRTVTIKAREKAAPVAPAVTRPGIARTTRSIAKKPTEPATAPSVATRSRGRRAMVS